MIFHTYITYIENYRTLTTGGSEQLYTAAAVTMSLGLAFALASLALAPWKGVGQRHGVIDS